MKINRHTGLLLIIIAFLLIAAKVVRTKNVLIIGDSISIGYTPFVQKALAPDVNVEHSPGNGGSTIRGKENVEKWSGGKEWDVILFNFGLHDLVYKDSTNKYDVTKGKIAVPLNEYRTNLELIVSKLKQTTAKLVFINTTVVPENSPGRKVDDPARYNAVAMDVMKKNDIDVIDLYSASVIIHPGNSVPGNVHYADNGYTQLADLIINKIRGVLF